MFVMLSRLFIAALWSTAGKGLTSWLSFVMFNCVCATFHVVSWVRCGTWLYRFLIFAAILTLSCSPACGCQTENELYENIVNLEIGETMDNVSSDSYLEQRHLHHVQTIKAPVNSTLHMTSEVYWSTFFMFRLLL